MSRGQRTAQAIIVSLLIPFIYVYVVVKRIPAYIRSQIAWQKLRRVIQRDWT